MNFDAFLTSPRWEILQIIAEKPSSPVEIAGKLNTTVSYVSQQLKLLDAANLLKKEKTGAAEKGKPRTLFSLSNELFYITILTKKFSEKKLIYLSDHHKTILKIWLYSEYSHHYAIEKFFWKLEEDIEEIEAIFFEISNNTPQIVIISESKKLKQKIDNFSLKLGKDLKYHFITKSNLKKFSYKSLISLHDPKNILEELKGGNETNE